MKMKFLNAVAVLSFAAILFTSCAKVPQTEIDAANTAIEEVKLAGADMYIHDTYVALQDSMNAIMVGVEAQKSKLFKNYNSTKEGLSGVILFAQEVKGQTEIKKEELKKEIQVTVEEVVSLNGSNKELVQKAPKGKEGASALLAIKAEIAAIDSTVADVNILFTNAEYMIASDKVKAAKEKATSINTELTDVIAKTKGRK